MNIFVLDSDPRLAATMQCDSHVVKMVLESGQMLCAAHRVLDGATHLVAGPAGVQGVELYGLSHPNHPCSIWVRRGRDNYDWLFQHFQALAAEYAFRYGKTHRTWSTFGDALAKPPLAFAQPADARGGRTDFAQCVPDQYRRDDAIDAYRAYYLGEKRRFARWRKGRSPPFWWPT